MPANRKVHQIRLSYLYRLFEVVPSNFVADEGDRFAVDIKQGGNEVIWTICGIEDIKDLRGGAAGEACYACNCTVFCAHRLGNLFGEQAAAIANGFARRGVHETFVDERSQPAFTCGLIPVDQLDGKIIIDTANKLGGGPMNSFATFQTHTPRARVFRAFNTLGWENFADPVYDGIQADLFYCGPGGDDREVVEQMISDVGLRPIRLGDVDQVSLVDSVGSLWFALALGQGKGRHLAFKVLSK